MKRITDNFLTTLTVLSRLPAPLRFDADFRLFGFFAPIIGIPAAVPLFAVSLLTRNTHMFVVLAVFGLFFQYWIFNLFHFDGLLDCADGYLFQGEKERRLEIMRDSSVGSYALFVGSLYILAKVFLVVELLKVTADMQIASRLIVFSIPPVIGRLAGSIIPMVLKPARSSGLGAMLVPYKPGPVLLGAALTAGSFVLLHVLSRTETPWGPIGLRALGGMLLVVFISVTVSIRRIGGYTGDTLGATIEVCELTCIIAVLSTLV